jgi:branched-chain amino acid transport system substrate-binding protein
MSKINKIILWIIAIIIIVALIWLGYSEKEPVVEGETIKIGVSVPLSGEAASYGEAGMGGLNLALKEINEKGGVLGKQIELIVEDDQCQSKAGIDAWNKLVNIDNPIAIIGPVCSSVGGAVLSVSQNRGIPTLIDGATNPELAKTGEYIFSAYPNDSFQGKYGAEYVFNKLNKDKVAIIYVQNAWGQGIKEVFSSEFEKLGGKILFDEGITQETIDIRTQIAKIKETEAELLYFPVYANNGVAGLRQLKELGFEGVVFGGDSFVSNEVWKSEGSDDTLYLAGKINNPEEFQNKVKEVSPDNIINFLTPLYYDALYIMTQAIERAGSLDRELIRNELAKTSYEGIALPLVEFDENGDLKEADFEVRIIKDGQSIPYEIQ